MTLTFIALMAVVGVQTTSFYQSTQSYVKISNPFNEVETSLHDFSINIPEVFVSSKTAIKKSTKRGLRTLPVHTVQIAKKQFSVEATVVTRVINNDQPLHYMGVVTAEDGVINNRDIVVHNGFKIETPVYQSMSSLFNSKNLMAEYKKLQLLEDIAKKALVAMPATVPKMKESDEVKVLFSSNKKKYREFKIDSDLAIDTKKEVPIKSDYSAAAVAADQATKWQSFKEEKKASVVSATVRAAISHAKDTSHSVVTTKYNSTSLGTKKGSPSDKRVFLKEALKKKSNVPSLSSQVLGTNIVPLTSRKSQIAIQGVGANFGVGFTDDVVNFQFIPEYDHGLAIDDVEGEIIVEELLSSKSGVIRGTLIKSGHMRTVVELNIQKNNKVAEINIPFIEKSSYNSFLDKHKLKGLGGHLLVELDDSVVDIELDAAYETKLYFDGDFKLVDFNADYSFVLYVGIEPGNSMISYLLDGKRRAEKVVHISDGELYFDANKIIKPKQRRISLVEKRPFGSSVIPLTLNEKEVVYFNTMHSAKELVPGVFSLATPARPQGFRNYIELKHIEGSIFVGTAEKNKIEVPSDNLISEILSLYNLNSLKDVCVIQLNLSKRPLSVKFSGTTAFGGMNITERFIEKSGAIAGEISELTKKIIFLGERQGVINLRIDYLDDSVELLQTICSNDTYLVEQL
ncbi:MAG: hypothetical protein KAG61_01975 [Bacteriovoracaceae bacterium]|nr:hypothetical protein [Bacteriovoracaceae bacterium]